MAFLLGFIIGGIAVAAGIWAYQSYRQSRAVVAPVSSLTQQIEDHPETIAVDEANVRDATGKKLVH